ncbi:MAG: sugar phosphate isomerase/epimerase [Provencibacterium sp.]|jgi:sugar phosphate isomerase/epimerase|nr:sugar phosphate isomerase/epimerase [Provencibacterium sp.]
MKKKVSIALGGLQRIYGDHRALEIAAQIGADAVDFNLTDRQWDYRDPDSVYSRSDDEISAYFEGLCSRAKELGLQIGQTHGRMCSYFGDPGQDEAAIRNARLDCLATRALHAPFCVMHGVSSSVMGREADPQQMRDTCFSVFRQILPFARKYEVILATETFGHCAAAGCCDFFGNIDEFQAIYERICKDRENAGYFAVCMDTGHCNHAVPYGNPPPQEVIRRLGKKIACLHLHDNDGRSDQHKIPMTGTIDWEAVFDALEETGYSGSYNLELHLDQFGPGFEIETAAFAVRLMRNLLSRR